MLVLDLDSVIMMMTSEMYDVCVCVWSFDFDLLQQGYMHKNCPNKSEYVFFF